MRGLISTLGTLAVCLLATLAWCTAARAEAPSLLGASTHPLWDGATVEESDHELDLLKQAGANTVRVDMGWSTLELDGKGQRNAAYVAKADTFFAHAHARGIKVILTFLGSPCWASSAPDSKKQGCQGSWWERGVDRYPPQDASDYADAAAWVANRWGADLAALELWNEPNFSSQYFNAPDPAAAYATLVKASYPKIKAVSSVPVLGGALLYNDDEFLEKLYAKGIEAYTDGISVHPYTKALDPASTADSIWQFGTGIGRTRNVMVSNGDAGKKLWITELGWSSCSPGQDDWCVNTADQASFVGNALRVARGSWDFVEAVNIYTLRNTGGDLQAREDQMGLLYPDFTPKPSFDAFAGALADLRANPNPVRGNPPSNGGGIVVRVTPPAASRPATPAAPTDRTAPVLRALKLRPAVLRRGGRIRVTWTTRETVRLTFTVERQSGRRWVRQRGSFQRTAKPGAGGLWFSGRLGSRQLAPGRYRLVSTARDRAGNRSKPVRTAFRVVAARSAGTASH